jgi:hypothetical protein
VVLTSWDRSMHDTRSTRYLVGGIFVFLVPCLPGGPRELVLQLALITLTDR